MTVPKISVPEVEAKAVQLVEDHWKGANVRGVQINDRLPHFFSRRALRYFHL
jgi:hypothetical protein